MALEGLILLLARRAASFFVQYALHPVMVQGSLLWATKNHLFPLPSFVFLSAYPVFLINFLWVLWRNWVLMNDLVVFRILVVLHHLLETGQYYLRSSNISSAFF